MTHELKPDIASTGRLRWRALVPLAASIVAVGAALAVPAPPPSAPRGSTGPTRLLDVWPSARPLTIDASLPGGLTFEPRLVLDTATTVGLTTTAGRSVTRLVVRGADGGLRVLQALPDSGQFTIAAVVVSGDSVFWLESGVDIQGRVTTTVWRAGLHSGTPQRLSTARSDPVSFDSQYDLELVDGRLYWAAYADRGHGEIRSIPVDGGSVQVRSLDRVYGLTVWPWVTSSVGGGVAGNVDMFSLVTGEHRTVPGRTNQYLNCTPTWCRVTTIAAQNTSLSVTWEHPDGTNVVALANHTLSPVNTNVALLNRFEVVESAAEAAAASPGHRILLHDLATGRDVFLGDSATGFIGSRDGFLWWSTGDNETTVWHVLDLHQLT